MNPEDFLDKYELYLKIYKKLMEESFSFESFVDNALFEYGLPVDFLMFCNKNGFIEYNKSNPSEELSKCKMIFKILRMFKL
jgi:hypothetical protein